MGSLVTVAEPACEQVSATQSSSSSSARVSQSQETEVDCQDSHREDLQNEFWLGQLWCSPLRQLGSCSFERSLQLESAEDAPIEESGMREVCVPVSDLTLSPSRTKELGGAAQRDASACKISAGSVWDSCAEASDDSVEREAGGPETMRIGKAEDLAHTALTARVDSAHASAPMDSPASASKQIELGAEMTSGASWRHRALLVSASFLSVGVLSIAAGGAVPVAIAAGSTGIALGTLSGLFAIRAVRWLT